MKNRPFHAEHVNDRWKRMMHRLIARELARNPEAVIETGKRWIARMKAEDRFNDAHACWERLLEEDPLIIRRQITIDNEHMRWLRNSSPLSIGILRDYDFRIRSYRLARRGLELFHERRRHEGERRSKR